MPDLTQRLRLDLPDALAGDGELAADFLKGVLGAVVAHTEAHAEDALFALAEGVEHVADGLLEALLNHLLHGGDHGLVLDEID